MEFLDYLEKSYCILAGKKYFSEYIGEPKIGGGGELDCHGLSHGGAVLQLLVYLDDNADKNEIEIISGQGSDYAMRDYILAGIKEHGWDYAFDCVHPDDSDNSGRILLERKK